MHFNVAMIPSLVSSHARTALPTPTPSDQERGQAHQAQERAEPPDHSLNSGRGVVVGAHLPARLPEPFAERRPRLLEAGFRRQAHRVLVIHEAAFANQTRARERVEAHQGPGPESERGAGSGTVGLARNRPPHPERDASDGERVALLEFETLGKRRVHQRTPHLVVSRQRRRDGVAWAVGFPRLDPARTTDTERRPP